MGSHFLFLAEATLPSSFWLLLIASVPLDTFLRVFSPNLVANIQKIRGYADGMVDP
jgi:hypothetical protein